MLILSKWRALGIILLAGCTGSYAQNFENLPAFAFNDNIKDDFLSYKSTLAEGEETTTDFKAVTIKTVPISIKVRDTVPSELYKEYSITDDGAFQYCYSDERELSNAKSGIKPITMRTFYLEASRNGVIPSDISYPAFSKMSVAEQQGLLKSDRVPNNMEVVEDTQAGMITYKTSPTGLQVFLSIGEKQMELLPRNRDSAFNTEDIQIKYLSKPRSVPLIVKVITDPFDRIGIPGEVEFNSWNKALNQLSSIDQQ